MFTSDWPGREGHIEFGANKIYYVEDGEGPPIVFIHGGAVDHRMWAPQLERFRHTNRVIAYDTRAHGRSELVEDETDDLEDLVAVLDVFAESRAQIVGLSFGAAIALDFALALPERVSRLVLMSPGLVGVQEQDPSHREPIEAIGRALAADDVDGALRVIERMTFEGRREDRVEGLDEARAYVDSVVRDHIARDRHTRLPRLRDFEPAKRLGEIACPTLIVYGAEDLPYVVRNARILAGGIEDDILMEIQGGGHLVNVERAEEVNAALEAFLEGREG